MYEAVQKCTNCGAGLTLDDLRGSNCKYCGTVFPHKAQAAQHADMAAQVMNKMMAQQAQIQDQWRGAFGAPPLYPPGAPPGVGPMVPPGAPGSPYADPARIAAAHGLYVQQIGTQVSRTVTIVIVAVVAVTLLFAGLGVAGFLLMR
ncbi:MAG TPA: hypothetical protein VGG39_19535 [Polyangiaceae bacterium]